MPMKNGNLLFFVSELNFDQSMYRPIAMTILRWAIEKECELVISAAGLPDDDTQEEDDIKTTEPVVYATASTKKALLKFTRAGIEQLSSGSVTGIPALLLNEGTWLRKGERGLLTQRRQGAKTQGAEAQGFLSFESF